MPQERPHPEKLAYGLEEAFELISVGRTMGFELLRKREIESVKIGRRRVIPADSLRAYLDRLIEQQSSGAGAAA